MTSDTRRRPVRWLALFVFLTGFALGCGDSPATKSENQPAQPGAQPSSKPQKPPPGPGGVKME